GGGQVRQERRREARPPVRLVQWVSLPRRRRGGPRRPAVRRRGRVVRPKHQFSPQSVCGAVRAPISYRRRCRFIPAPPAPRSAGITAAAARYQMASAVRTPLLRRRAMEHRNGLPPAGDGLDRRGMLECMAWVGTGLLWTVGGGLPAARL